jgi:putative chitinase
MVHAEQILRLAPRAHLVYRKAFDTARETLARHEIDSPLRVAHFFAQVLHESGGFTVLEESLNYSVAGLIATFGKRIPRDRAEAIGRTSTRPADQRAIGDAAYGGAWGKRNLGNTEPGDGYRFRGRGAIQITGRANYRHFGELLGIDLEKSPELAIDPRYVLALAGCYWQDRKCNEAADLDDLRAVTKRINGGAIGLEDRAEWLVKTKAVWPQVANSAKCIGVL